MRLPALSLPRITPADGRGIGLDHGEKIGGERQAGSRASPLRSRAIASMYWAVARAARSSGSGFGAFISGCNGHRRYHNLFVVVESPAKAKTINKYLGSGYRVLASYGHVRDLPAKDGSVRPEQDFEMTYEIDARSKSAARRDRRGAEGRATLYLATDPDREGEAISWHVLESLRELKKPSRPRRRQARRLQRDHQARRPRRDEASARRSTWTW
jgi:hypothetical protein